MNPTFDSLMSAMGYKRMTCKDCKHAVTSIAYPKLQCLLRGIFVAPTFSCNKIEVVSESCES